MEHMAIINGIEFRCESNGTWDKPGTWTSYYIDGNQVRQSTYDRSRDAANAAETTAYDEQEEKRKEDGWQVVTDLMDTYREVSKRNIDRMLS